MTTKGDAPGADMAPPPTSESKSTTNHAQSSAGSVIPASSALAPAADAKSSPFAQSAAGTIEKLSPAELCARYRFMANFDPHLDADTLQWVDTIRQQTDLSYCDRAVGLFGCTLSI
jgi:hypothetical protein